MMYEAKCLVMDYQQPNSVHQQHLHQLHSFAPAAAAAAADASSRWTQYQQLWRQHQMFMNGARTDSSSSTATTACWAPASDPNRSQGSQHVVTHYPGAAGKTCGKDSPEKKEIEDVLWNSVDQAAFLAPNLWDKNLPYDADLKYCDLDEFLSDNGIPLESQPAVGGAMVPTQQAKLESACLSQCAVPVQQPQQQQQQQPQQPPPPPQPQPQPPQQPPQANGIIPKREPSPSPSEALSPIGISPPSPADSTLSFASSSRDFDPRSRPFSDEELKPQPMVKKSRKQFVPDGLKDEKYWARRRKNNMAAKRSRDARRLKENQIALRAGFLEKENMGLRTEMERLKRENHALRDRLSKYTDV